MSSSEVVALGAVLAIGLIGFTYSWVSLGRVLRRQREAAGREDAMRLAATRLAETQLTLSDEMAAATKTVVSRHLIGAGR